jgi:hypothetical protein
MWISAPLSMDYLNLTKTDSISKQENRTLAPEPPFNISLLDPYPAAYENFFNDHFPYRRELTNFLNNDINLKIFNHLNEHDGLNVGKDGWLFAGYEQEYWEGTNKYKRNEIRTIVSVLHTRTMEYRKRGIRFYVLVPPMKSEIYPEQNPPFFYRGPDSVMTDLILAAIRKDTSIALVIGKEALLQNKDKGLLFYATDSHWNNRGAYYAYRSLFERIHKDFPRVNPLTFRDIEFHDSLQEGAFLAKQYGIQDLVTENVPEIRYKHQRAYPGVRVGYALPPPFTGNNWSEKIRLVKDSSLPKALVIHDSYGDRLIPLISENFRRTIFFFDAWYYGPNWEIIDKEKPDLVIMEIFAPHFRYLLRWK